MGIVIQYWSQLSKLISKGAVLFLWVIQKPCWRKLTFLDHLPTTFCHPLVFRLHTDTVYCLFSNLDLVEWPFVLFWLCVGGLFFNLINKATGHALGIWQNPRLSMVLKASKSGGAKGDVPKIFKFVHSLSSTEGSPIARFWLLHAQVVIFQA